MKVAIIMGSTSDLSKVEPAVKILKDYERGINNEQIVLRIIWFVNRIRARILSQSQFSAKRYQHETRNTKGYYQTI